MVYIEVPDKNDSMGQVDLEGKQFHIRFTYNDSQNFWCYSLYDEQRNLLLGMQKIVPYSPMNYYYTYTDFPDGVFGCFGIYEVPTRYSFRDGLAKFAFISKSEMEEVGLNG